jgi:hypothetical protein
MSTRSSIYYHEADQNTLKIHIYTELACDDEAQAMRMEIEWAYCTVNFALPPDLQKELGIG